ncbi:MAG TPA: DUF559 domain-containing protein [Longimicrobiales bacterium]|nr:DUF559 domain-containing protein [Longimicrobiales bacterium]
MARDDTQASRARFHGGALAQRPDAAIAALATAQYGIVTRPQLIHAGISRHVIDHRIRTGGLRLVHSGVYQVGPVVAVCAREMAAVLVCGGAILSDRTAATLWQVLPAPLSGDPVEVTVPAHRHCVRRPGIRAHRRDLAADEITRVEHLPITTAARTLLDLSGTVSARELERAVATAERARLVQPGEIRSLLDRHHRRPGTVRLRALLESSMPSAFTRSEAEERLLALIRRTGLPEPEMNVVLHGYEVDCFWRLERLAVEVDGYAYHASARAFNHDRRRDSALAAAGIQVLRLSWQQITRESEKTLVQLAQALARARPLI